MTIRVLAFASARAAVGARSLELELPTGATVGAAWARLVADHPALAGVRTCALAVNRSYVEPDTVLREADELALLPPVSGG